MSKRNTMKKVLVISMLVLILLAIFAADGIQQRRFNVVRTGYEYMEDGQYSAAAEAFEQYLSVDSDLYWLCIDWVNGDSYTREGVKAALEECLEKGDFSENAIQN